MGRTPRSTPSFQHPPLKRMLHWPGLEPAPSDCRSDALPLRHSAKVTAKDERDVFSLFSQYSHSPPAPHATQETWREPTSPWLQHCCSNGERLRPGCKPVVHASCIVPRWCCHLYYGDHSFDNNHQMGRTPRSTPSFQHPPLKRMLHWPGLEPAPSDCRSDALPLRHSAKVTAKDERDVFSLFSQYSHSPPAPHATQETWREPTSPWLQHCCSNGERLRPGCKPVLSPTLSMTIQN